ncbi:unnamed protein product [Ectocarpus sp. 12 AP-2014]
MKYLLPSSSRSKLLSLPLKSHFHLPYHSTCSLFIVYQKLRGGIHCCCCCCLKKQFRSLFSTDCCIWSASPSDADTFRGHKPTASKGGTLFKEKNKQNRPQKKCSKAPPGICFLLNEKEKPNEN